MVYLVQEKLHTYLTTNLSVYDVLASIGLLAGAVLIMRVVLEALDADADSPPR